MASCSCTESSDSRELFLEEATARRKEAERSRPTYEGSHWQVLEQEERNTLAIFCRGGAGKSAVNLSKVKSSESSMPCIKNIMPSRHSNPLRRLSHFSLIMCSKTHRTSRHTTKYNLLRKWYMLTESGAGERLTQICIGWPAK